MALAVPSVANILTQFFAFIADNDDDALQLLFGQLLQQTVDEPYAIHGYHTLGVVPCIFS